MSESEKTLQELGDDLRNAITEFFVPLQTVRTINYDAFDRLYDAAKKISHQLKGQELVPKSILREIHSSFTVLHREAPYFETDNEKLTEMASRLAMLFTLVLRDETPEDRIPGVPRII